jgi:hypothetical protein
MFKLLISTHVGDSHGCAVSSVVVDFSTPQLAEDAIQQLQAAPRNTDQWYTVIRLYRS